MEILFGLLALTYFVSIVFGKFLERFKIPWIFSALFLGMILSLFQNGALQSTFKSEEFQFLANLGIIFMLFIIGFELEVSTLRKLSKFIFTSTFFIILIDALMGTFVLKSFGYPWIVSLICALSFATVGEAILIPILEEFNLVRTKFGTTIIGIGTVDDIIEVFTIFLASSFIGTSVKGVNPYFTAIASLLIFFIFAGLLKLKKKIKRSWRSFPKIEDLFIFSLFILMLFVAAGSLGSIEMLGALLAGLALRNFLPKKSLEGVEKSIKLVGYGVFGPIFFLYVGANTNLYSIFLAPLLTLVIFLVSMSSKILASLIAGYKRFGFRKSLLMGIGLSVRFSTGLVIVSLLFSKGLIDQSLFSALVAASSLTTIIVPILFSYFVSRFKSYNLRW